MTLGKKEPCWTASTLINYKGFRCQAGESQNPETGTLKPQFAAFIKANVMTAMEHDRQMKTSENRAMV